MFLGGRLKNIMTVTATLWKNTSKLDLKPFIDKAKSVSDRYKTQMKAFSQTDEYKKQKMLQKRQGRLKQRIKHPTSKELLLQTAFDFFSKDHGGTLEEIKALWDDTDDMIKDEYISKCKINVPVQTTRSRREIKLPSRFSDSLKI